MNRHAIALLGLTLAACSPALPALADPPAQTALRERPSRVETLRRGVAWLVAHQHPSGGWASAEGYGGEGTVPDVATTAIAVLALQRDANDTHDDAIRRGVSSVVAAVERAPDGPLLHTPGGTQIQRKLGPYVDTHLAVLMLGETLPRLDGELETRARAALAVAIGKTVQTQGPDGAFGGGAGGWAPVLSSTLAAQGLATAVAHSFPVEPAVLTRSDGYQRSLVNLEQRSFSAVRGAGVQLYAVASALRGNDLTMSRTGQTVASPGDWGLAQAARGLALEAVVEDESGSMVTGFGSIGGEEVLSYLMISETLAGIGGPYWAKWDPQIGEVLGQAQNGDGSWSGHHCITSQPFTTAAAILTLTTGRGTPDAD